MLSSLFDVVVVSREGEGVIVLFLRPFPHGRWAIKKRPKNFACGTPKKLSLQVECRSVPITVTSASCRLRVPQDEARKGSECRFGN